MTDLAIRILDAIRAESARIRGELNRKPYPFVHLPEGALFARGEWILWRPTEWLGIPSDGPGRRLRNETAHALRELLDAGLVEAYRHEGSDRVYAVRLVTKRRRKGGK